MEVPVIVEFLDEDGWLVRMPSALEPCLFERDGRIILRIQEDCLGPNEFYIKGFLYSARYTPAESLDEAGCRVLARWVRVCRELANQNGARCF